MSVEDSSEANQATERVPEIRAQAANAPSIGGAQVQPCPPQVGDYELLEEIARGGMGVVYRARDTRLNRVVAIKMMLYSGRSSAEEVERFRIEAESVAELSHPNIVPIHEVGVHQGHHFYSMRLVAGPPLSQAMASFKGNPIAAVQMMVKVTRAVHHAHQRGILHRDLKPGNILIDSTGEPYVTDFGLAKRLGGESSLTMTGAVIGTPSYMAPEQAIDRPRGLSTAVDIYALGAIFYHLLVGRPPFQGENSILVLRRVVEEEPPAPSQFCPNLDPDLESICLKCLEKEPTRRYGSADDLARDLERWLKHEPISARRITTVQRAVKWARRRPAVAGLAAALVLTGFTGLMTVLWQLRATETARTKAEALAYSEGKAKQVALRLQVAEAEARRLAETTAESMRLNLYVAQVQEASRQFDAGRTNNAQELLNKQIPRANQSDLRGFEWFWLQSRMQARTSKALSPINLGNIGLTGTVAWSPDGQWLVYPDRDSVLVYAFAARTNHSLTIGAKISRHGIRFSPDNRWLAVGSEAGIYVWETATWTLAQLWNEGAGKSDCNEMAFSPDGSTFAYYSATQGIVFRETQDWAIKSTIAVPMKAGPGWVQFAFAPNGRCFAMNEGSSRVRLLKFPSLEKLGDISLLSHTGSFIAVEALAFSQDGKTLALGTQSGEIHLWPTDTLSNPAIWHAGFHSINALQFSPDGNYLYFGGGVGTVQRLTIRTRESVAIVGTTMGYKGDIAFSPGGEELATMGARLQLTRLNDDFTQSYEANDVVNQIWFQSEGRELAAVSPKGIVRAWQLNTNAGAYNMQLEPKAHITFPAFSVTSSNALLAFQTTEKAIAVYNVQLHKTICQTPVLEHEGRIASALSQDAQWLVAAIRPRVQTNGVWREMPGNVRLWHLPDLHERTLFTADKSLFGPNSVAISPCSQLVVANVSGRTIHIWKAEGDTPPVVLEGGENALSSGYAELCISPDENWLASRVVRSNEVQMWNLAQQKLVYSIWGHKSPVNCLAFTPDSLTLATGGDDNVVKLWNVKTGSELITLPAEMKVDALRFAQDNRYLAAGSGSGKRILVWRSK